MKVYISFLLLALLPAAGMAQTARPIVPIFEQSVGGIIGGTQDGKWVKDQQVATTLKGGDEYRLIDWNGAATNQLTRGGKPAAEVPCEDFYHVELEAKAATGVALGSSASWDPVPRRPVELAALDPTYLKIVRDLARSKGIARPQAKIMQIYRVDLDGDGTEEVVLAALYRKGKELTAHAAAGDYAFVLLRKLVNGLVKNILLAGQFHRRAVKFGAIDQYAVSAIADLNGDGKMEIVMSSQYYEGGSSVVYEINGGQATEVLSTGCGV